MKSRATALVFALGIAHGTLAHADVVRPAPQVAFPSVDGAKLSLKSFRGQPIIVLLADASSRSALRTQIKEIEKAFDRLAIRKTLVAVALKDDDGTGLHSNIPLTVLPEGASACDAFQLKGKFAIALIGPDGNLDYQTDKILNINRILEVMQNSYEVQKGAHR